MKIRKIFHNIPNNVRDIGVVILLWIAAIMAGYVPQKWQDLGVVIGSICVVGSLTVVFFIIQRFFAGYFNRLLILRRMNAHILYGRLNIINVKLMVFLKKLNAFKNTGSSEIFHLLEKELPTLMNEEWLKSLIDLARESGLHQEEKDNFKRALDQLTNLWQSFEKLKRIQNIDSIEMKAWQTQLCKITQQALASFKLVIWHIEA